MEQKYCQSCGMPLSEEMLGTNADGSKNEDYCQYCYKDGEFLQQMTMDEMIEHCSQFVDEVNKNMSTPMSREEYIGRLKVSNCFGLGGHSRADFPSCIAHKTGTGFSLPDGGTMGIGDAACIVLPDGSHFELVVFIKDASCDARACEDMVAKVARTVLYSRF